MIQAVIFPRALDGNQVLRVGDDADCERIPPGIRADRTEVAFGQVLAYPAGVNAATGIHVSARTKVPVKYVGVGEKADDLLEFDPKEFTKAFFE